MVWPTAALRCSQHNFFAGVVVTQAVKLVKEGWAPIFGGDANLARWAVELDCFGHDSFKYTSPSTRCHKDVANGMFRASHRIESITRERS